MYDPLLTIILDIRYNPDMLITNAYYIGNISMNLRRYENKKIGFLQLHSEFVDVVRRIELGQSVVIVCDSLQNEYTNNIFKIINTFLEQHNKPTATLIDNPTQDMFVMTPRIVIEYEPESVKDAMNEIIPNLFLGSEEAIYNCLEQYNIRNVLSVMNYAPNLSPSINQLKIDILDTIDQHIEQYFNQAFKFIDESLSKNQPILVHCQAGVSRSATIVIAYIMKTRRISMNDAISFVTTKRNCIAPNIEFLGSLFEFETNNFMVN